MQHLCDTARGSGSVVIGDKSCGQPLHSLNLVDVLLQVRIPKDGAVLQDRPDKGLVLVDIMPTLQDIGQKRRFLILRKEPGVPLAFLLILFLVIPAMCGPHFW